MHSQDTNTNIFNADQRLTGFYSLLFNWMAELSHEFPGYFDREDCMKWAKDMLAKELRHYQGMGDSSKNGTFHTNSVYQSSS